MGQHKPAKGPDEFKPGPKTQAAAGIAHPLLLEVFKVGLPILMKNRISLDFQIFGSFLLGWLRRWVLDNKLKFGMVDCHVGDLGSDFFAMSVIRMPIILQSLFFLRGEIRNRDRREG